MNGLATPLQSAGARWRVDVTGIRDMRRGAGSGIIHPLMRQLC